MGILMPLILLLAKLCIIGFALVVQGSSGHDASPFPAKFFLFPPTEGIPGAVEQRSETPSTLSQPNGSDLHSPPALPPLMSAPMSETTEPPPTHNTDLPPFTIEEQVPSLAPRTPVVSPPFNTAPPPLLVQVHTPSKSPTGPQKKEPVGKSPFSVPDAPAPVASPSRNLPQNSSATHPFPSITPPENSPENSPLVHLTPVAPPLRNSPQNSPGIRSSRPSALPPTANQRNSSNNKAPVQEPTASAPVASQLRNSPQNPPAVHSIRPSALAPTPSANQGNSSNNRAPILGSIAPVAINSSPNETAIHSQGPTAIPPSAPIPEPIAPVASPPRKLDRTPPPVRSIMPPSISPVSVVSPSGGSPHNTPTIHPNVPGGTPSQLPDADIPPVPTPPSSVNWNNNGIPVASPANEIGKPVPPVNHTLENGSSPAISPALTAMRHPGNSTVPALAPLNEGYNSPASSPVISFHKHQHTRNARTSPAPASSFLISPAPLKQQGPVISPALSPSISFHRHQHTRNARTSPAPASSYLISPAPLKQQGPVISPALSPSISVHKHQHTRNVRTGPAPASSYLISPAPLKQQGPVISPAFLPGRRRTHHAPAPLHPVSPSHSAIPSSVSTVSPVPSPSPLTASRQTKMPLISPKVSSSVSPLRSPKVPPPPPVMSFPPPPPNEDCSTTICTEPYTNSPPGSPCDCVLPMQVGLRLSVALYTFFPLVSELAKEIAAGVFMKQSQVRIIGANAASEQPEKTVVLIDLVPLGQKFDNTTAFLTYQRFWHKQVAIKTSLFGDYEVLYVHYHGLPPSPPLPPSDIGIIDAGPYSGNDNNARVIKPLGVDVHGKRHKFVLGGGVIAIIVLSMLVAMVLCSTIAWFLVFKRGDHTSQQAVTPQHPLTSLAKPSGSVGSMIGSGLSSTSLSFGSSIVAYTGSAKTLSASEIEKATDNFDASRVLGEGGFGRVYSGVLEDGTKVAVKVLKRDDQQGGREFLAEVEMLSRLHHRNLVKLIGICTEERNRCLVYELIPNGSVESHLHGVDKESAPLDWDARIKIALGSARGLAYLHEDSSPRVIHRDFKSSNILLEHDFTPKVSDFGLARTAMDEEGRHISTRVMGTFGYVAPEYAMTGHLLVKSDVYSYGVVLLELLTGRKPVDMTQPPGQENLVAWARPLLANKEGLETIIDPLLGSDVPFDNVAKVAAIASMCVQPEVSHRPFMGEVVQALKLVCNECDEAKEVGSRGSIQDDLSIDLDAKVGTGSGQLTDPLQSHYSIPNYDSCLDTERGLSVSDLFSSSARFGRQTSGSLRRHCSSGPLRTGRGSRFWQKIQRLSRGSISEHGAMIRFWPGSH
ncbi:receptor-like serine/threonine-protein kinase ALE2 isoform X2 [Durio zibethinus]|uniref:Receptor-like serine/threonine-protein kinase ALE2 isoform X2 n=1 Tax=Durio zibethinus TaxID=66656 RepID=A0A6P5XW66_DURZI|nr:receptor-like serine/threonine-protein kinase ALE2 isoform X2 [Durio zibethinus]